MQMNRTKNATRNMLFGTILKLYQTIIPFIMRTVMIYFLGVDYLGLNSLFTSVLQVLNLAELGVGSAMVFSMYEPIAEGDTDKICALMRLYKIYYRLIGLVILVVGLVITPLIPKLISGDVPADVNVYVLYLLNLTATVLTYWLFAYKNSILVAHQRNDVGNKVMIVTDTVKYIMQMVAIIILHNYYYYVVAVLLTQALGNMVTAIVADHLYPLYSPHGDLPSEDVRSINRKIRDLFAAKLGGTITNSADTIVISAFLGLAMLAVYQNYYYIMSSVIGFVTLLLNSCTAGIGNSLITESLEKNYNDFNRIVFMILWIATVCCSCFMCLYQPFMTLWVGSTSSDGESMLLPFGCVVLFSVYFFVYVLQQTFATYKDAAGIWHEDRFRPFIGGLANLVMNLIAIRFWGIYAILLSTIISYVMIAMPWLAHSLFQTVFRRKPWDFLRKICRYAILTIGIVAVTYFLCTLVSLEGVIALLLKGIICVLVPNIVQFFLFRKTDEFAYFVDKLRTLIKSIHR